MCVHSNAMNGESEDWHFHSNQSTPNGQPHEKGYCAGQILDATSYHQDVQQQVMPIAVVGMSCRFPGGSTSPANLWDTLANGRSGWSQIPRDRFTQSSFQHPSSNVEGTVRKKAPIAAQIRRPDEEHLSSIPRELISWTRTSPYLMRPSLTSVPRRPRYYSPQSRRSAGAVMI